MGGTGLKEVAEGMTPAVLMVISQVVHAGLNILYKLALNDGMDVGVLVAYRYIFASAFMGPLAFFVERKSRPKITRRIWLHSFLCGLLGGTLAQNFYVGSVKLTSATFTNAMSNLMPACTFVLAVAFRLESLRIQTAFGQAKVVGTLVGIGGAMLLTLYKGPEMDPWPTSISILKLHQDGNGHGQVVSHQTIKQFIGSLLAIAACFCYALWIIVQAKMSKDFPCPYSSSALMSLMGAIQAFIVAICMDRDMKQWRLRFDVRLLTVVYGGVLATGLNIVVMMWCIKRRGPLFTSIFNPLQLVVLALISSPLLGERLHLGCVLGSCFIVIGLYIVLWGKRKEAIKLAEKSSVEAMREAVEVVIALRPVASPRVQSIAESSDKAEETPPHGPEIICLVKPEEEKTKTDPVP